MIEHHAIPKVTRARVAPAEAEAHGPPTFLEPLELEALAINLDASLRVHAPHQFFSWTQGLLQNLLRHELLICAVAQGRVDVVSRRQLFDGAAQP
jgi:hypothetical protein